LRKACQSRCSAVVSFARSWRARCDRWSIRRVRFGPVEFTRSYREHGGRVHLAREGRVVDNRGVA
jgi:hypothetical protein